ncbi:hypothetical protein SRABI106_00764 [Rahnella aquatilis]|nr:hypothetical protein SRABI106_00764 [Rahnella aquatilis]
MGDKGWRVVFGAVNDAGLHAAEHFTDAHRHRIGTHRFQRCQRNRTALYADFHAVQIFRFHHRFFGDQVTRPAIHPAEKNQSRIRVVGDFIADFFTDLTVEHFVHMVFVAENIGQGEDINFWQNRSNRRHRHTDDIQRTELRLFNFLLFISQHAARKRFNFEASVCLLLQFFAHVLDGDHVGIALRMHVGGFQRLC